MSDSAKAGKVPAVLFDVPSAPAGWHLVPGVSGLFHAEIPVPSEPAETFIKEHRERVTEAKKAWEEFEQAEAERGLRQNGVIPFTEPACPLKVVRISESKAEDGLEAQMEARGRSVKALREMRRASKGDVSLAHVEHAAVAGGEE